MPSLDEFQIIESEQKDTLKTEVEVLDMQVGDVSTQGVASKADVSSPGRRVSRGTITSPSSSEMGGRNSQKVFASSVAPSTPTV